MFPCPLCEQVHPLLADLANHIVWVHTPKPNSNWMHCWCGQLLYKLEFHAHLATVGGDILGHFLAGALGVDDV